MRKQITLMLIVSFLICIPLVFALDVGIGDDQIGINLNGFLNIRESWLTTFINNFGFSTEKDTNTTTECNEGYYLDGSGNCIHFNNTVMDINKITYYNATSVDVVIGTIDDGDITSIQKFDGISLNVSETNAKPGLDIRINFTGVEDFKQFKMRFKTSKDISNNLISVDLWDFVNGCWCNHDYYIEADSWDYPYIPIPEANLHIGTGANEGEVWVRVYDEDKGKTSDIHYIDFVQLSDREGSISSVEVDPLSYHKNADINFENYNINGSGKFTTTGAVDTGVLMATGSGTDWSTIRYLGAETVKAKGMRITHETSGVIADGFASAVQVKIKSTSGTPVDEQIGQFRWERVGADNTSDFRLLTFNAGASVDSIFIDQSINRLTTSHTIYAPVISASTILSSAGNLNAQPTTVAGGTADADWVILGPGPSYQLRRVTSSERYKENIRDTLLDSSVLYDLRLVDFQENASKQDADEIKYREDTGYEGEYFKDRKFHIGLIAEEVNEVSPDLVVLENGKPEAIDNRAVSMLMLKEIQNLNERFKDLETENQMLKDELCEFNNTFSWCKEV